MPIDVEDDGDALVVDEPMESLEDVATKAVSRLASIALDDPNQLESIELPGADLSGESLAVEVIPVQADEFQCSSCFLIVHMSRRMPDSTDVCVDCAE